MLKFLLKAVVSGGILWWVLHQVDFQKLLPLIQNLSIGWSTLAIISLGLSLLSATWRWYWVLQKKIPWSLLSRGVWVGFTFNQGLPSTIGGDIFRLFLLKKQGMTTKNATFALLADRLWGLIGLMILVCLTVESISIPVLKIPLRAVCIGFILGGGVLLWPPSRRLLYKIPFVRQLVKVLIKTPWFVIPLCVIGMMLTVLPFYCFAKDLAIPLSFSAILTVIPLVFLIGMLPISLAGWGLREGSMVLGLGYFSIAPEGALALSLLYGVLQWILALPGLVWYLGHRETIAPPHPTEF